MKNICIVGATGLVGSKLLTVLDELDRKDINVTLYASLKSVGREIFMNDKVWEVQELHANIDFASYDIALFSAGQNVSRLYGPRFANAGCYVVDNSSYFRMDKEVPLAVMGVNFEDIKNSSSKIISNPNCSTIQSVLAINQLRKKYEIEEIDYVTYQAVSGSGIGGINDLQGTLRGEKPKNYDYQIANNIIPQIDYLLDDGYSYEEEKMMNETKKIFHDENLKISATCVRVPVINGHSVSIKIKFKEDVPMEVASKLIEQQDYVEMLKGDSLPMPLNVNETDVVQVGRLRNSRDTNKELLMMVAADNLRIGAATNAVKIVDYLIKENLC